MNNYDKASQNIVDFMANNFKEQFPETESTKEFYIESGRTYDKIICKDTTHADSDFIQRSVSGFICKKDNPKKNFKIGDMLMAASFNAPATNKVRGNIFEDTACARVRWTGIF